MNALLHGGESLYDSEWLQLADFLQVQWPDTLHTIINILSPGDDALNELTINMPHPVSPVSDVLVDRMDSDDVYDISQKWLNSTIDSFENENANILEQVLSIIEFLNIIISN